MEEITNIQNYQYNASEKLFFKVTTWTMALGLLYPVVNNGSTITNFLSLLVTTLALIAILLYYNISNRNRLYGSLRFYIFVVLYMLVIGAMGGAFSGGRTKILMVITNDLRYVSLFWLGGLYALNDRYMAYFHKIMIIVAKISVIMGILGFIMMLAKGNFILRSEEDNQIIYHLWWAASSCSMYCAYQGLVGKTDKRICLAVLLLYFVLGMSFLKRACFVDVLCFILLSVYILTKTRNVRNGVRIMLTVIVFGFMIVILLPGLSDQVFSSLFERFSNTALDMESFDRAIEWRVFLENTSYKQRLFGFGIGNYLFYDRYGFGADESLLNALHLGYANIIYKGGVLYALFYISLYIKVIVNWFRNRKKTSLYLVCFGVAISSFISLFFEGSWTYTIQPFCISAPIFYATTYSGNKEPV